MDKTTSFSWNEEEIQLLLEVVLHCKTDKAANGSDWISIKLKYLQDRKVVVDGLFHTSRKCSQKYGVDVLQQGQLLVE